MDWIHCNNCHYQPGQQPKRDFQLTSCGHIFCRCCERSGTIEQCKMCAVKCTTTPLSAQMAKEVQIYFEDTEFDLRKMLNVMEFQKSHRQRLYEYHRKVLEKYHLLKVDYHRLEEENKALKNELASTKRTQHNKGMMPPLTSPQLPLFSKNSQASKLIRMGMSQSTTGTPTSPFFATPTMAANYNYRSQRTTPSTPMSDASSMSPLSVSSRNSYRAAQPGNHHQQSSYRPGLTPPISNLRLLSVNKNARNAGRF